MQQEIVAIRFLFASNKNSRIWSSGDLQSAGVRPVAHGANQLEKGGVEDGQAETCPELSKLGAGQDSPGVAGPRQPFQLPQVSPYVTTHPLLPDAPLHLQPVIADLQVSRGTASDAVTL
jgi:hypothetical protein